MKKLKGKNNSLDCRGKLEPWDEGEKQKNEGWE